jgi:hypothetical protein
MKLIPKYSEKLLKTPIFFFLKMVKFWTLVDQDFLTTDIKSLKNCFFFVSTHPGQIHCEKPAVSWRSVEQRCNLAQKWPFSSPNRRAQTLTKLKNILYGVY